MPIERSNWGPKTDGPRETPGNAGAPAAATDEKHAEPVSEEPSHTAVDDDDSALHRKLLADGIFTPAELAKHYGLSDAEVDELSKPVPKPLSRQDIDKELAEIAKLRRTDRRAYNKDEAMQARERELLEARDKPKAGPDTSGQGRRRADVREG